MALKDGTKSGGRAKGTPNRSTSARQAALERVNHALSQIGEDAITGTRLLREVLNSKDAPLEIKIQCAGFLQKHEQETEAQTRYVAVMPLPVKDLDEWKRLYMEAKPAASPEDVAWHENIARQVMENEKGLISPKTPWSDAGNNQ